MTQRLASILVLAATALLSATVGFGMTNADLLKLKESGLSDETILLSMAREPADYDVSPPL